MFRPPTKYSEYLQDVRKSIDYILKRVNEGSGAQDLADLGDVDIYLPTEGQLLGYNSTTGLWENVTAAVAPGGGELDIDGGTFLIPGGGFNFDGGSFT